MAKRLDQHRARLDTLSRFGKDLTRRSGSSCELCAASGVKLGIFEVAPAPNEPDFDACIFICETCHEQIDFPKRRDPDHWRCLNTSVWSEVPAVQVQSVLMLRQLLAHDWARDLEEMLYLPPEIEDWLARVK